MKKGPGRRNGFTLVEILLVMGIIAMLAALAFPGFARARVTANEMVSISTCRTLSSALESYRSAQTPPTYPDEMSFLGDVVPAYLDETLVDGTRRGYIFEYEFINENQYELVATPEISGVTGVREFYVDETGIIRVGTDDTGTPIE
ncbi:MAG: type II secretion system GspH family protein [Candidatus Omnitrophica bacterium]|nr:type II secretion system GspH family protein [Candidatus Omnitrophota bacterium]